MFVVFVGIHAYGSPCTVVVSRDGVDIDASKSSNSSSSGVVASRSNTVINTTISGVGVDISSSALNIARQNADNLQLDLCSSGCDCDDISFFQGSFQNLHSIQENIDQQYPFDVILCNPPYSSIKEVHRLSRSRTHYEPAQALFNLEGGPYASYRAIAHSFQTLAYETATDIPVKTETTYEKLQQNHDGTIANCCNNNMLVQRCPLLVNGGRLFLEIGSGQEKTVREIFKEVSVLQFVQTISDHKNIPRCLEYKYC